MTNDTQNDTPEMDDAPETLETEAAAEHEPSEHDDDPVAQLLAEKDEMRDRLLRALAEIENTRKRAERDVQAASVRATERFAGDLLGVADNLSRALDSLPAEARTEGPDILKNLLAGVELTERELMKAFERHGVTREDPKGEPFDPNRHQAVAQIPSAEPAGRVAEVMQTGYRIGDRTLRAAMVAVSTGPVKTAPGHAASEDETAAPGGQADIKI